MAVRSRLGALARLALVLRWPVTVAALAALGGLIVFVVATSVFPYHSLNHDEGVYLQQAAMLLDGKLFLNPPVSEAFRPWFFVESANGLYPKYAPVPALLFAPGVAVGEPRLALSVIGAGIVALVTLLGAELFDRSTGFAAGVVLISSPLFVIDTSVFLPYAPTTLLNLGFAVAYLRAQRIGSRLLAAFAGVSIGLAFFARPYTAVLFALPFVGHALWTMRGFDRPAIGRQLITAAFGLLGVGLTLGYNAAVTGDPTVFPYAAFAPNDGLGFGYHEILGHGEEYTVSLAIEANSRIIEEYVTDWVAAGTLGTVAALSGLAYTLKHRLDARRVAVAALFLSVPLGELYFWGTLNTLGNIADPTDGLAAYLGTYYHYDLLVPSSVFAGVAMVGLFRNARARLDKRYEPRKALAVGAVLLLLCAPVAGGAVVTSVSEPIERNTEITRHYEAAYEPFEERDLSAAVVFLPEPYGPWLNHPFQHLRNDPTYERGPVYALTERELDVTAAFPDRELYRYVYRNAWTPTVGDPVEPRLSPVERASGERVRVGSTVGVPDSAVLVSIRVQSGTGTVRATVSDPPAALATTLTFEDGQVVLDGPALSESVSLALAEDDLVSTTLFVDYGSGSGFSYEIDTPVRVENGTVRTLSPTLEYCRIPHRCNGRAAYIPSMTPDDVFINTTLETVRR